MSSNINVMIGTTYRASSIFCSSFETIDNVLPGHSVLRRGLGVHAIDLTVEPLGHSCSWVHKTKGTFGACGE